MFKAKILAELVKQYPGLDKKFLGTIADKLAAKVTEEEKIEGAVSELNTGLITITDLAAEFQKEGDRRATDAVETHKKKFGNPNPNDPPKPPADPDKPVPPGETASEKLIRELAEKVAKMEAKESQATKMQTLKAKMEEKKIPFTLAKNAVLTEETDLDALVTSYEADFNELKQTLNTEGFKSNSFIPGGSGSGATDTSKNVNDAIVKFAKHQNEQAKK